MVAKKKSPSQKAPFTQGRRKVHCFGNKRGFLR